MTYGWDFTNPASPKPREIDYNADNMPVSITYNGSVNTTLLYDGMGTRVKKSVGSTHSYYIGDYFEIKGGTITKYIFAGNLRVAQIKGSTRSYFHKDHLGSSTVMTDNSGAEIESTNYMPFGSQRDHSGTDTSDYRFTDQELDSENGLYNYGARLYDPFIGRFISPDTIVQAPYNPQSLNRYSYCLNNPLRYTDPSGHAQMTYEQYIAQWENQIHGMQDSGAILPYNMLFPPSYSEYLACLQGFTTGFEYWMYSDPWNSGFEGLSGWLYEKALVKAGKAAQNGGGVSVVKNIIPNIEKGNMSKVKAIVLHSTGGSTLSGAINAFKSSGYGTHYIIDKNGTIYQTANLNKYTYHVGKIQSKAGYTTKPWSAKKINDYEIANNSYPQRYPTSSESIGIEIVRGYSTSSGWEAATKAQLSSLKSLVVDLQKNYKLSSSDIYHHDKISYKTAGEGGGLGY